MASTESFELVHITVDGTGSSISASCKIGTHTYTLGAQIVPPVPTFKTLSAKLSFAHLDQLKLDVPRTLSGSITSSAIQFTLDNGRSVEGEVDLGFVPTVMYKGEGKWSSTVDPE